MGIAPNAYRDRLRAAFWRYRAEQFAGEDNLFDDAYQPGGAQPPVLRREHAHRNVLLRPGATPDEVEMVLSAMPAGTHHKWMCAPKGAGFLYARREVQGLLEPLVVSWGWEPERTNLLSLDGGASRFVLEQEWQGSRDPGAYLSVPAAIQFQAEHDWARVRAECHELLREARGRLEELTGLLPICPDSPEW